MPTPSPCMHYLACLGSDDCIWLRGLDVLNCDHNQIYDCDRVVFFNLLWFPVYLPRLIISSPMVRSHSLCAWVGLIYYPVVSVPIGNSVEDLDCFQLVMAKSKHRNLYLVFELQRLIQPLQLSWVAGAHVIITMHYGLHALRLAIEGAW